MYKGELSQLSRVLAVYVGVVVASLVSSVVAIVLAAVVVAAIVIGDGDSQAALTVVGQWPRVGMVAGLVCRDGMTSRRNFRGGVVVVVDLHVAKDGGGVTDTGKNITIYTTKQTRTLFEGSVARGPPQFSVGRANPTMGSGVNWQCADLSGNVLIVVVEETVGFGPVAARTVKKQRITEGNKVENWVRACGIVFLVGRLIHETIVLPQVDSTQPMYMCCYVCDAKKTIATQQQLRQLGWSWTVTTTSNPYLNHNNALIMPTVMTTMTATCDDSDMICDNKDEGSGSWPMPTATVIAVIATPMPTMRRTATLKNCNTGCDDDCNYDYDTSDSDCTGNSRNYDDPNKINHNKTGLPTLQCNNYMTTTIQTGGGDNSRSLASSTDSG
ncbi:hypothetical protein EDB85DRAFT_1886649 [Lactarius pseudohatsudake]|nr:hypothetical protein EDB85DRAFT_1886649 [Lactarius pseudohatsudake]